MKITGRDADFIRENVLSTIRAYPNAANDYQAAGHSHKRYRWDILWSSRTLENSAMFWQTLEGYADAHIDTLLRSIVGKDY